MIRIAQVGTFDVDNLGDLLFPVVFGRLVAELAEELRTPIECEFFSPQGLAAGHLYRDQPGSLALEHLDRIDIDSPFDLIFIGGGDIIRDDDASLAPIYGPNGSSTAFSSLSSPTTTVDSRLVLLMPGVPFPLSPSFEMFLENSFRRLRFAAVRDRVSAERLAAVVPADMSVEVLPDIVGTIAHFHPRAQLLALEHSLVAPDVRGTGYICFQAQPVWCADVNGAGQALRQLEQKTGLPVVLIAIGPGDDRLLSQLAERFAFALARPPEATGPGTLMEKVAVIAASRGFVGTSLHGSILAHAYGVPHFCFSGDALSKIRGFYETCATGRSYSDFAECVGQLDAIGERISRPVTRGSKETAVTRVKNFVRRAIESVTDARPRRASPFARHVELQYRRDQAEGQPLDEPIATAPITARLAQLARFSQWRRSR